MALQIKKALIPPHPLTNFEIKEYYENEPRFNGVYSRDNLPKTIKNGAYVINLDEYAHIGLLCMQKIMKLFTLIILVLNMFLKKLDKRFIGHKNTKTNIFRILADNSIICGYFCIGFIDFMFAGKSLIDFTSFLSPYDIKKNDDIILSYFK